MNANSICKGPVAEWNVVGPVWLEWEKGVR
jgi:hypothetical protein